MELSVLRAVVVSLKYVAHANTPSCPVESQAISEPNLKTSAAPSDIRREFYAYRYSRVPFACPNRFTSSHAALDERGVRCQALPLHVIQQVPDDRLLHQTVVGVSYPPVRHAHHRRDSLVEVPFPRVRLDEAGVVARDAVQRPVRRDDVHVVVSPVRRVGRCLVPRPPVSPEDRRRVIIVGYERGLVVVDGL